MASEPISFNPLYSMDNTLAATYLILLFTNSGGECEEAIYHCLKLNLRFFTLMKYGG
jgi:hypothetical protein